MSTSLPSPVAEHSESLSPNAVYSTAHAVWSSHELQLLHRGLAEYPCESYDNVTRYIKIAANIPAKCVRDVAFKVKAMALDAKEGEGRELYSAKRVRIDHTAELLNMASQQPLDESQLNTLFQDNVHALNTIRNNLLNGKSSENRAVMIKFRDNCHTLMSAISDVCNTIPPLPIKLDTSLITSASDAN